MLPLNDQPVPIRLDEHGVARIGGTRIPLETVVSEFEKGASAEEIAHAFSALSLADVYSVISYMLRHRDAVATYMQQVEHEERTARIEDMSRPDAALIRKRLLSRLVERQG